MVDTTGFRTDLMVNDHVIPLNDFVQHYMGTVLFSVVSVLGSKCNEIAVVMNGIRDIEIYADNKVIELRKQFVRDIIGSTVKGFISPLKGVFLLDRIIIRTRRI